MAEPLHPLYQVGVERGRAEERAAPEVQSFRDIAIYDQGRLKERAALAAHLTEGIDPYIDPPAVLSLFDMGYKAALVDTLTWLEARNGE